MGALDGVRVVDFGQYVAGPLLGVLLADAGASVVHVDPPGGPRWRSPANAVLMRNKELVELDLKTSEGLAAARRLVAEADVLIEGFRPGVMDRLGLGPDEALALNAALVYCSLPGFAADDPRAGVKAWEGVVSAATSVYREARAHPGGPPLSEGPVFVSTPLLSTYAAAIAAHAVAAALLAGVGQRVEVSLYDAAFEIFGHELQMRRSIASGGFRPPPRPGLGHYRCKDGRWLHLCLFEDRHMRWFASRFVPEWLEEGVAEPDRLRAEPALQDELTRRFRELFATRDAADWERDINNETGAPCAVCQTTEEWLTVDDHARDSGAVVSLDDPELGPTAQLGQPVVLSRTPLEPLPRGTFRPWSPEHRAPPQASDEVWAHEMRPNLIRTSDDGTDRLPLEGVRVLDLTQVLAGPTAARVLAEYGADVIKVNKTEDTAIAWHTWINAGKRSILLDVKAPAARDVIDRLLATADVVSQNFALGVADRLGVGEPDARKVRPDVVYSSISAFGYEGRRGTWRGREELGQAVAGLQDLWRDPDGVPAMMSFPVSDVGSGHLAAFGILLSLLHRRRAGEGQAVSGSLAHTASFVQAPFMLAAEGVTWDLPAGMAATGWAPLHRIHRASDRWFFVAADALEGVEGLADLAGQDVEGPDGAARLEARLTTETAETWVARFTAVGHGAHVVVTAEEMTADPYARRRGLIVDVEDGGHTIGSPPRLSVTPVRSGPPATLPGIDGRVVVEDLGLGEHWATLVAAGAVVDVTP
jgi:crotonobetainyl-CoA:carnitine CoA-transferase CaiB-like acyl-CoA transferase